MDENNKLHYYRINGYSREVQRIFDKYNRMFAVLGLSVVYDKKKGMFYFRNYSEIKTKADKIIKQFAEDVTTAIKKGCSTEWEKSNLNNDILAQQILGKIWQEKRFAKYFQHNTKALNTFLKRRQNGLNLSQKVWNCSKRYMNDIEKCLSIGIDKGISADKLAKVIKQYIENPTALDIEMRNVFSTSTSTNSQGQGVYRSAYKNAMRLTRTETNMAYRSADNERWRQMDFVLGYKVQLSGSHPLEDVCDQLQGDYPTTFKFVGWHPHCLCFATAILQSKEDFFNNKEPKKITDLPQNFKDWYNENYEKILNAQEKDKLPYFIKDNFTADSNGVLQFNGKTTSKATKIPSPKEQAKIRHAKRTQKQIEDIKARWYKRLEKMSPLNKIYEGLKEKRIDYINVGMLNKELAENKIIQKIEMHDKKGRCVSLALAYIGNKCGYDVKDGRTDASYRFFALKSPKILENLGAVSKTSLNSITNAETLLVKMQKNKEYILIAGYHCSVVKFNGKDWNYLELQDTKGHNGWKKLSTNKLISRFGCSYLEVKEENGKIVGYIENTAYLLDTDVLRNDLGFRHLLGYLNTQK